jgi:hypothetical protein
MYVCLMHGEPLSCVLGGLSVVATHWRPGSGAQTVHIASACIFLALSCLSMLAGRWLIDDAVVIWGNRFVVLSFTHLPVLHVGFLPRGCQRKEAIPSLATDKLLCIMHPFPNLQLQHALAKASALACNVCVCVAQKQTERYRH